MIVLSFTALGVVAVAVCVGWLIHRANECLDQLGLGG